MSYYEDSQNVHNYIKRAQGYDGQVIIQRLKPFLATGARVLELGMGPGTDFVLLSQDYDVVGSDYSQVFLDLARKQFPNATLLHLNAETLDTNQTFDAIYSHKVLHHLTDEQLQMSIQNQLRILNPGGLTCHGFWEGEATDRREDLIDNYHTEEELRQWFEPDFDILVLEPYQEIEPNDSLLLIARKRG